MGQNDGHQVSAKERNALVRRCVWHHARYRILVAALLLAAITALVVIPIGIYGAGQDILERLNTDPFAREVVQQEWDTNGTVAWTESKDQEATCGNPRPDPASMDLRCRIKALWPHAFIAPLTGEHARLIQPAPNARTMEKGFKPAMQCHDGSIELRATGKGDPVIGKVEDGKKVPSRNEIVLSAAAFALLTCSDTEALVPQGYRFVVSRTVAVQSPPTPAAAANVAGARASAACSDGAGCGQVGAEHLPGAGRQEFADFDLTLIDVLSPADIHGPRLGFVDPALLVKIERWLNNEAQEINPRDDLPNTNDYPFRGIRVVAERVQDLPGIREFLDVSPGLKRVWEVEALVADLDACQRWLAWVIGISSVLLFTVWFALITSQVGSTTDALDHDLAELKLLGYSNEDILAIPKTLALYLGGLSVALSVPLCLALGLVLHDWGEELVIRWWTDIPRKSAFFSSLDWWPLIAPGLAIVLALVFCAMTIPRSQRRKIEGIEALHHSLCSSPAE